MMERQPNQSSQDGAAAERGVSIAPGVTVPEGALRFAYARSGGPGGQNVNKVASKAELRVAVEELPLRGRVIARLRAQAGRRIVGDEEVVVTGEDGVPRRVVRGGELVIVSQEHRSQSRNREQCLERLRELLVAAMVEPRVRRKTRPTRGSVERRLGEKKRRSDTKRRRGDGTD